MPRRRTILALFVSIGLVVHSGCLAQAAARPDDATVTSWIRQPLLKRSPQGVIRGRHGRLEMLVWRVLQGGDESSFHYVRIETVC